MSLDFVVLNDRDRVDRSVAIGVDAHHRLMSLCKGEAFELLTRFRDYYEEGEIFWQELDALEAELDIAGSRAAQDKELERIIGELLALAQFARTRNRSIVAIPD